MILHLYWSSTSENSVLILLSPIHKKISYMPNQKEHGVTAGTLVSRLNNRGQYYHRAVWENNYAEPRNTW